MGGVAGYPPMNAGYFAEMARNQNSSIPPTVPQPANSSTGKTPHKHTHYCCTTHPTESRKSGNRRKKTVKESSNSKCYPEFLTTNFFRKNLERTES